MKVQVWYDDDQNNRFQPEYASETFSCLGTLDIDLDLNPEGTSFLKLKHDAKDAKPSDGTESYIAINVSSRFIFWEQGYPSMIVSSIGDDQKKQGMSIFPTDRGYVLGVLSQLGPDGKELVDLSYIGMLVTNPEPKYISYDQFILENTEVDLEKLHGEIISMYDSVIDFLKETASATNIVGKNSLDYRNFLLKQVKKTQEGFQEWKHRASINLSFPP